MPPETVNVVDRTTGQTFGVPAEQLAAYTSAGFRPETDEESIDRTAAEAFHAEHGGVGGAVGSALAGGLSGLTLGLSDQAIGGLGGGRTLRHMEAEHPYATVGGTLAGALLPTVLSGGAAAGEEAAGLGARILARTPAGLAGRAGGAISGLGEGAGLAGRVAAGTAGAAAEGALYGGGQYLTETALEDKPLSAEGFVAGMGHGALFAAPIGGTMTLAGATLQRARSLFPRADVSAAAAAGVKEQASGALAQAVRDGDTMVTAAERRLSDIDAGVGMAQAGETTTRRVFGEAHPQALADQVTGATARQEVGQALEDYQQARAQFEDWLANEADPAFAAAMGKLDQHRPVLDRMLAGADQGDLETLLGQVGGGAPHDEQLARAMRETLARPDVLGTGGIPVDEFGAPGSGGFKGQDTLARLAAGTGREEGEQVAALSSADATGAGGPRALLAQGTPSGGVPAQEIVQRGMAEQPATAVGKRPATVANVESKVPDGFDIRAHAEGGPIFSENPSVHTGVPKLGDLNRETFRDNAYIVRPSELEGPKLRGITSGDDMVADARTTGVRKAWSNGERVPALEIDVDPEGHYFIADGNHRLLAAAAEGDRPMLARFRPVESEVGNMDRIGDDLSRALRGDRGATPDAILDRHSASTRFEHLPAGDGKPERIYLHLSSPSGEGILSAERTADGGFQVGRTALDTKLRGQGVGTAMYERLNQELESKFGQPLMSAAPVDRSKTAEAVWKRLEHRGVAERAGDRWVMKRPAGAAAKGEGGDLLAALSGTKSGIDKGENLVEMGAPAREAYRTAKAERTTSAAEHFRAKALEARGVRAEAVAAGEARNPFHEPVTAVGSKPTGDLPAPLAQLRDVVVSLGKESGAPVSAAEYSARREAMGLPAATAKSPRTVVDKDLRARMGAVKDERAIAKAIMRHNGKNVDMGPALAREAKVIGDMEGASARLADALGSEAPPTAVANAKAFHAASGQAQERAAASSAKLGADLQHKVPAMTGGTDATVVDDDVAKALRKHESRGAAARADKTTVSPAPEMPAPEGAAGGGIAGRAADVGSALEVLRAIGMHVPAVSHIPVIGPILGLWLKARAVMGILGRKGGSIGKSTEGLIASKAAAVQDRIVAATGALLEGGARAAGKASHLAGPAVLLAGALFPGGEQPKGDSPRELFEARSDDITRAMQPGAIDQAIAQRYPTSDPATHDAIVAQVQRGIAFLDSKRPKQTVLPGVLPGDGTWKASAAAIDEFAKFVHAVNDPVSVLEDLAKGHPSAEGAETLRVVYPQLYQYAQKQLLAAAPEMAKTLPYPRRVMLSILYQIPVDGTMQPSHAQYLAIPAPPTSAPKASTTTGPLRLGQQTMSPLDQRAAGA